MGRRSLFVTLAIAVAVLFGTVAFVTVQSFHTANSERDDRRAVQEDARERTRQLHDEIAALNGQIKVLSDQLVFTQAAAQNTQQAQAEVLLTTIDQLATQVRSLGGRPVASRASGSSAPPSPVPGPPGAPGPQGSPGQSSGQGQGQGCALTVPGLGCVLR